MKPLERFIVGIESDPWSAVYRAAIGFVMLPVFRVLLGDAGSIWTVSALFVAMLVGLRVVPALLRHSLPFSAEAKEIWRTRRNLSKRYDSYAWQKLFWIGVGSLLFAAVSGGLRSGELAVMLFCLAAGGAGQLAWRRSGAAILVAQAR